MLISVIGCGYLGATHAAGMAELGFDVVGVESDPTKVAALRDGRVPFYEPGLPELLSRHVEGGRLRFTDDIAEATDADVHFVCVGTPQQAGSLGADLTYVDAAIESLAPLLTRPTVVVGKSTVPVGTAERLTARLAELAPAGTEALLAWNPEFLREGFAVEDTLRPDRLVFGVTHDRAEQTLREVYATALAADTPLVVTDLATAELVKVSANAFLATKISFINAMAEICEKVGADVTHLADAIGHDKRIGRKFLNAGVGFGGGCLPKDIRAFQHRASELGVDHATAFLRDIDAINQRRREHVVELTRELTAGDDSPRVAVLGAAFKPDSDDVRDSPALWIAQKLHTDGYDVVVHDPEAIGPARAKLPDATYTEDLDEALAGADIVLHLTEWPVYRQIDPARVATLVRHARLVDGRTLLDVPAWRAAGWEVRSLGRP
ncbi:UDP-glucose 6-dehydrogenase [Marmoricola endophyticus]|uniref:UDP-glucose 6-dehydrogenase n=1 Tax=Marmoricola endophyticus TaxID=2040280 RepID=A0A917BGU7_9ACTN|nr:UDP-glucose/GDP-mannose dehydrogenase family protein [Marmoricola endophyticus]GGF42598.1 UDP-glucose 6-dehydrogenase [Marmoricola endophyticus]